MQASLCGYKSYLQPLNRNVMLPAPELCPVKVVGEEVLESVGSGGDQYRNLHNITNHCTRPMLNYPYSLFLYYGVQ